MIDITLVRLFVCVSVYIAMRVTEWVDPKKNTAISLNDVASSTLISNNERKYITYL